MASPEEYKSTVPAVPEFRESGKEGAGAAGRSGVMKAVSDTYYALEDKYYAFLDRLSGAGIPVYSVVDPIDRVFPSLILFSFIALVLLIVAAFVGVQFVLWLLSPKLVTFAFVDGSENPLEGVSAVITQKGVSDSFVSDAWGVVQVQARDRNMLVEAEKEGYRPYAQVLVPDTAHENLITLTEEPAAKTISIRVKDADTSRLLSVAVDYSFSCTGGSLYAPPRMSGASSEANISVLSACGVLSVAVSAEGYEPKNSSLDTSARDSIDIRMRKQAVLANLTVSVYDTTGSPLASKAVKLKKAQGTSYADTGFSGRTDATGAFRFEELPIGTYYAVAEDPAGEFAQTLPEAGETALVGGDDKRIRLTMRPLVEPKKILFRFEDSASSEPVEGVRVFIYRHNERYDLLSVVVSGSDGTAEKRAIDKDYNYSVVASHSDYITKVIPQPDLLDESVTEPRTVRLVKSTSLNSGSVKVSVNRYKDSSPVEGAAVSLYSENYGFPVAAASTEEEGTADFANLPPATYYAAALLGSEEGRSNTGTLSAGSELDLVVTLVLSSQTFGVTVKDYTTGGTISDAEVSFFDAGTADMLGQSALTGENGKAEKDVRLDRTIYVLVSKEGYLSHTTVPYRVSEVAEIEVMLHSESEFTITDPDFDIEFYAVYDAPDEANIIPKLEDSGTEGEGNYWFKFRLIVLGDDYRDFYAVVRGGLQEQTDADDSYTVIKDAVFANAAVSAMSCYGSDDDYEDCSTIPQGEDAKQVVFYAGDMAKGVYDIFVEVYIKDVPEAEEDDTPVQLHYGAKAVNKDGDLTFFRPPEGLYLFETLLGGNLCTIVMQECPIEFRLTVSAVGHDSEDFMPVPVEIGESPTELLVEEGYNAYRLDYEIYNNTKRSFSDVTLSIKDVLGVQANLPVFDLDPATLETESELTRFIDDFSRGTKISDSIPFRVLTSSAGASIAFDLGLGRPDSNAEALFIVRPVRDLSVKAVPSEIYAGIKNSMKLIVEDEEGSRVPEAAVKVFSGSTLLTGIASYNNGLTDSDGSFYLVLPQRDEGEAFTLRVEKPGYNSGEITLEVKLSASLKPGAIECISVSPLKFENVRRGGSVDFMVTSSNCGETVSVRLTKAEANGTSDITINPNSFELQDNSQKRITVTTDRWLGVHPVFVEAATASDPRFYLTAVVELYITDAAACLRPAGNDFDYNVFHSSDALSIVNSCYTGYSDDGHLYAAMPSGTKLLMELINEAETPEELEKITEYLLNNRGERGTKYILMELQDYICGKSGRPGACR
jgi:hypothetical protein